MCFYSLGSLSFQEVHAHSHRHRLNVHWIVRHQVYDVCGIKLCLRVCVRVSWRHRQITFTVVIKSIIFSLYSPIAVSLCECANKLRVVHQTIFQCSLTHSLAYFALLLLFVICIHWAAKSTFVCIILFTASITNPLYLSLLMLENAIIRFSHYIQIPYTLLYILLFSLLCLPTFFTRSLSFVNMCLCVRVGSFFFPPPTSMAYYKW